MKKFRTELRVKENKKESKITQVLIFKDPKGPVSPCWISKYRLEYCDPANSLAINILVTC